MSKVMLSLYRAGRQWAVGASNKSELLAKEAQEVLVREANTVKPRFTFGTTQHVSNPTFTFGERSTLSARDSILSIMEHQGQQNVVTHKIPKFGRPEYNTKYVPALLSDYPDIRLAQREFYNATGLRLHSPTTLDLRAFTGGLINLEHSIKGTGTITNNIPAERLVLPPDVKHVLIGHGMGSVDKGSWAFYENGQSIFEYVNKNIPKGERAIVLCCELGGAEVAGKSALGKPVSTMLTDPSKPAKIIESGRNEIIGQLVLPPFGTGVYIY